MRKKFWAMNILMLLIIICLAAICGCDDKTTNKKFEKAGLTITLTREFYEKEHVEYTAYYASSKMIVVTVKETFDSFEKVGYDAETMSVEDYARLVVDTYKDFYTSASEISIAENMVSFIYETDALGKDYKYIWYGFKAVDAFWAVQFGCVESDFDNLQIQMLAYAKTVEIERFEETLGFEKIVGKEEYRVVGLGSVCDLDIVIPTTYNDLPVTEIADRAFSFGPLTSVVIPDSVVSIGMRAFANSEKLQSVTLGKNVETIGTRAFEDCHALTSIEIPDSVTTIGWRAFADCWVMTEAKLGGRLTTIEDSVFQGCNDLETVNISEGATFLGAHMFSGCKALTNISLPNSLTTIKMHAFSDCSGLERIVIPDSVTDIQDSVFQRCKSLKTANLPVNSVAVPSSMFEGCNKLSEFVILDGVHTIGDSAFAGCSSLREILIPSSVTTIGKQAFSGCRGLTEIVLPDSVEFIGFQAFYNCSQLSDVRLGNGINAIEAYTFGYCINLTEITIPETVTSIGEWAFGVCTGLLRITIPDGVSTISENTFHGCEKLESITLGKSVSAIEDDFYGCRSLIKMEANIENAYYTAIEGVLYTKDKKTLVKYPQGKKELRFDIPDSVTKIGEKAFQDCVYLQEILLPQSVTDIGARAFENCLALKKVNIPDGVTSIADSVFYNCANLKSIVIPDSVSNFGGSVFYGCPNLTIYCEVVSMPALWKSKDEWNSPYYTVVWGYNNVTTNETYDYVVHDENASLTRYKGVETEIVIPTMIDGYKVVRFGDIFKNNQTIVSVVIPDGITVIADQAFYGCTELSRVEIPDSMIEVGYQAFYNCGKLCNVLNLKNVTSISTSAFDGCGSLKSVVLSDELAYVGYYLFNNTDLTNIYYVGTMESWAKKLEELTNRNYLRGYTMYYYSEEQPIAEGNYWHYDKNGEITIW